MPYKQRDIILTQFPFTDLSGSKLRPALIISNNKLNANGDYVCIQITSKKFSDDCSIELKDMDVITPMKIESGIRLQKIFTIHTSIVIQKISEMNAGSFAEIIKAINVKVLNE